MNSRTYWLQYFADGGAPGGEGGTGAAAGVDGAAAPQGDRQLAAAAGQQDTLEALGVPREKAERYRAAQKRRGARTEAARPPETPPAEAAQAGEEGTGSKGADPAQSAAKPKWEDILKDPEYKQAFTEQMNTVIAQRFAKASARDAEIAKLTPALEMLAKKYGTNAGDYEGLAHAIIDDDSMYREAAAEKGLDVKAAKELTQKERELDRLRAMQQQTIKQQMVQQHLSSLYRQGEEMKAKYPGFNLEAELSNDTFVKLTQPGMLSVEDAYAAVHRKEIEAARQQAMQQQAMAAAEATVRAGQARPKENGSAAGTVINRVPPAKRSREERRELCRQIKAAAARGEKLPRDW